MFLTKIEPNIPTSRFRDFYQNKLYYHIYWTYTTGYFKSIQINFIYLIMDRTERQTSFQIYFHCVKRV